MSGEIERAAIDAELVDLDGAGGVEPVDLDAVLDGEIVEHRIDDSPLYGHTRLQGRIVTCPDEVEAIRRCVEFGRRPWWRRLFRAKPAGWMQ